MADCGPGTPQPQEFRVALDGFNATGQVCAALQPGWADLRVQPAGGVAAHALQRGLTQPEAVGGQGCGLVGQRALMFRRSRQCPARMAAA